MSKLRPRGWHHPASATQDTGLWATRGSRRDPKSPGWGSHKGFLFSQIQRIERPYQTLHSFLAEIRVESRVSVLLGKRSMPSPCPSLAWEPHSLTVGSSVGLCIPGIEPWCPSLPRLPCPHQLLSSLCCLTWHCDRIWPRYNGISCLRYPELLFLLRRNLRLSDHVLD